MRKYLFYVYAFISKESIPEGIEPIVLKDKAELYDFIKEMDKVELCGIIDSIDTESEMVATRSLLKNRSEGPGITSITSDLASGYTIIIQLAYTEKGSGSINVSSTQANTWAFAKWEQTSGVASWIGESSIQYSVAGNITWYIVVDLEFIEVDRKNMTVSGTVHVY